MLRRTYLYLMSLMALIGWLAGTALAGGEVLAALIGGQSLSAVLTVSPSPVWLAVGAGLVWALHRGLAARAARPLTMTGAVERASAERKAYLYVGQLAALIVLCGCATLLVNDLLLRGLGEPANRLEGWPGWPLRLAFYSVVGLLFWLGLRWTVWRDGDWGQETGAAAGWRRFYYLVITMAGTGLAAVAAAELLRTGLGLGLRLFGVLPGAISPDWRSLLAGPAAMLVVTAPLAVLAWRNANRITSIAAAAEADVLTRTVPIYGWQLAGTIVTLFCLAELLRYWLTGLAGGSAVSGWLTVETLLAYLPVAGVLWLAFALTARADRDDYGEGPHAAVLRRVLFYGCAAVGLAALWFGLSEMLRLGLPGVSALSSGRPMLAAADRERFGLASALMLTGGLAWWSHWWPSFVRSRRPDHYGRTERRSLLRRAYLWGAIVASVAVILLGGAWAAAQVLADAPKNALVLNTAPAMAVAAIWGVVHWLVLRGDQRLELAIGWSVEEEVPADQAGMPATADQAAFTEASLDVPAPRRFDRDALPSVEAALAETAARQAAPPPAIAVIDGGDGAIGAALLTALRPALPAADLWPVGLNAGAQMRMLDALAASTPPALSAALLAQAAIICGPADILTPDGMGGDVTPELAAAILASPARILLLPPRDPRLRWVAAPDWPVERWVEYAVAEAVAALTA